MTVPSPLIQYKNRTPWVARRGTPFDMQTPSMQPRGLVHTVKEAGELVSPKGYLPCTVCVEPTTHFISTPCLSHIKDQIGRINDWSFILSLDLLSTTVPTTNTGSWSMLWFDHVSGSPPFGSCPDLDGDTIVKQWITFETGQANSYNVIFPNFSYPGSLVEELRMSFCLTCFITTIGMQFPAYSQVFYATPQAWDSDGNFYDSWLTFSNNAPVFQDRKIIPYSNMNPIDITFTTWHWLRIAGTPQITGTMVWRLSEVL